MPFTPSPQQAALFDWIDSGSGSCVLEAVAGAGKTTTLIHALARMKGDVFFGAYNKKIAEEIKARVPTGLPGVRIDVGTMHAAGFRFWRRVAKAVVIDGDKCRKIFRVASERTPAYKPLESVTLQLVGLAKQSGVGVLTPAGEESYRALLDHHDIEVPPAANGDDQAELVIKLANRVMKASAALDLSVIDFDDMIFAPLLHGAKVWQHDWVLVDEAQDTNATRRELALRMLKPNGRLIAVGDRHQAIYGFTGADSDALDLIARATKAVQLPLTTTYRCPKSVVAHAQQWVSHIHSADSAPEGSVARAPLADLIKLARPGDAVLCRKTAPLITNVYAFIAKGIPARVEGREIGNGLKALAQRWKTDSLATLETYIATYAERETAKLRAKEKDSAAAALEDKVECLRVIMARVRGANPKANVADLVMEIDGLFGDGETAKPTVTFSTIHKSKGREWRRVVWLETGPSPWARQPWQIQQEANLCYVATTRAQEELFILQ